MAAQDDLNAYDIVSQPLGLWAFLRDLPSETAYAMNAPTWRPPSHDEAHESWADTLFEDALREVYDR